MLFAKKPLLSLTLLVSFLPSLDAAAVNKTGIIQSVTTGNCWYMTDYTFGGMDYDHSFIKSKPCDLAEKRQFFTYLGESSNLMSQYSLDCVDAWYESGKDYHVKMWECHTYEKQQHWALDGVDGLKTKQDPSGYCMFTDGDTIKSIPCDDSKKEVFRFYVQPPPPEIVTAEAPVAVMQAEKPHVDIPPATKSGATGDPHITLFGGKKYDFHGGCDLVLLSNPAFAHGLGLHIHIRTKIQTWWSYIESAVVKIGDDTLEIMGGEAGEEVKYWVNGQPGDANVAEDANLLAMMDNLKGKLGDHSPITYHHISAKQHRFRIDTGYGQALALETFKTWVAVNLKAVNDRQWAGSLGLMGSYPHGEMVARDGVTVFDAKDTDAFGKHWQVLSTEPMLFHTPGEGVHHPQECAMPEVTKKSSRRLGEYGIAMEAAELACAHVDPHHKDSCVYDVMASNDIEMAGAY